MLYLYSNNILHRDLKPENIFLDDYLFPKIGDFGLSSRYHSYESMTFQSKAGLKGSPVYSSPEILQFNNYTKSGDVYAFALAVFEIVTNEIPFIEIVNINQIYNEVVNKSKRPIIKQTVSDCYRKLIQRCWSQNPEERPSFSDIVETLKNDKSFITENIREKDYRKYIEFIENSEKEMDPRKRILDLEEFINNKNKIDENEPTEDALSDIDQDKAKIVE